MYKYIKQKGLYVSPKNQDIITFLLKIVYLVESLKHYK